MQHAHPVERNAVRVLHVILLERLLRDDDRRLEDAVHDDRPTDQNVDEKQNVEQHLLQEHVVGDPLQRVGPYEDLADAQHPQQPQASHEDDGLGAGADEEQCGREGADGVEQEQGLQVLVPHHRHTVVHNDAAVSAERCPRLQPRGNVQGLNEPSPPVLEAPVRKIILQMHTPASTSQCWSRQAPHGLGVCIWMHLVNGTGNSPSPGQPTPE